jgi:hypothetical protein
MVANSATKKAMAREGRIASGSCLIQFPTSLRGLAKCSQKKRSPNKTEKTMRCEKVRDAIHGG